MQTEAQLDAPFSAALKINRLHTELRRFLPNDKPLNDAALVPISKCFDTLRENLSIVIEALATTEVERQAARANEWKPVKLCQRTHSSHLIGVTIVGLLDYCSALAETSSHELGKVVFNSGRWRELHADGIPTINTADLQKRWPAIRQRLEKLPNPDSSEIAHWLRFELETIKGREAGSGSIETQEPIELSLERIAQAVGDENAGKIMAVARGAGSADKRMQQILLLDRRFASKDSKDWGVLLGVTDAAIRRTATWNEIQQRAKNAE